MRVNENGENNQKLCKLVDEGETIRNWGDRKRTTYKYEIRELPTPIHVFFF